MAKEVDFEVAIPFTLEVERGTNPIDAAKDWVASTDRAFFKDQISSGSYEVRFFGRTTEWQILFWITAALLLACLIVITFGGRIQ